MAGNTFYLMEAVNLFSDRVPDEGKHLTLTELKLPDLVETMADHRPGGAPIQVEFPVGIDKLEATFKLNGVDPLLLAQFGLNNDFRQTFTAYGAIRDQKTGVLIESKAIIRGRLSRVAPDNFTRGDIVGHEYSIGTIMHYELWFDNRELFWFDFFTNGLRINAVDVNADLNRILRVPTSA